MYHIIDLGYDNIIEKFGGKTMEENQSNQNNNLNHSTQNGNVNNSQNFNFEVL